MKKYQKLRATPRRGWCSTKKRDKKTLNEVKSIKHIHQDSQDLQEKIHMENEVALS